MKKKIIHIGIFALLLIILSLVFGIKYIGNMSEDELRDIVERDAMVFKTETVSDEVLQELAKNEVVVMGEYHNISEHNTFMRQLSTVLNKNYGFSDLLVEAPQAFSWIFEDYSTGAIPEVDDETAKAFWFYIGELGGIRQYNLDLPYSERLKVGTIDINHSPYPYVMSIRYMLDFVKDKAKLEDVFKDLRDVINDDGAYIERLNEFKDELAEKPDEYKTMLGEKWYERLVEMTVVEIFSHECRNSSNHIFIRKSDRIREDIIGQIVDDRIGGAEGKVLINVGGNHAQKKPVRGTKMKWLGEYLQYESPQAAGQTYCMLVVPAKGTIEKSGTNGKAVDLFEKGSKNELFRIIAEKAEAARAFLSLDDDRFAQKKVMMNFHYDIQSLPPKELYDGVVILPNGTYINPFPDS